MNPKLKVLLGIEKPPAKGAPTPETPTKKPQVVKKAAKVKTQK